MVTCPWCGTTYPTFQSNCSNCGGPLPAVDHTESDATLLPPPPAPRQISDKYVWRLISTDGWSIAAFVFVILGLVFSVVGTALTFSKIAAFVGVPFLCIGLPFLAAGGFILVRRYQQMHKIVDVLKNGAAVPGRITEVQENYSVTVNGRHPWMIRYQFLAAGQDYDGKVTTLNPPGPQLQAGKDVYVLYLTATPRWNSLYPHP
jgi:hypothetical protein